MNRSDRIGKSEACCSRPSSTRQRINARQPAVAKSIARGRAMSHLAKKVKTAIKANPRLYALLRPCVDAIRTRELRRVREERGASSAGA